MMCVGIEASVPMPCFSMRPIRSDSVRKPVSYSVDNMIEVLVIVYRRVISNTRCGTNNIYILNIYDISLYL